MLRLFWNLCNLHSGVYNHAFLYNSYGSPYVIRFEIEIRKRFEEDFKAQLEAAAIAKSNVVESEVSYTISSSNKLTGLRLSQSTHANPLMTVPEPTHVTARQEEANILERLLEPNCISCIFDDFLGPYVMLVSTILLW